MNPYTGQYAQLQQYPNLSPHGLIGTGLSDALQARQQNSLDQLLRGAQKMPDGTKPVVICKGIVEEAKDMEAAQRLAESTAHERSADAYILKPVKRVAPKRDVITTDL